LLLEPEVDLVGRKGKAVLRLEPHHFVGLPKEGPVKLDVDPEDRPAGAVQDAVVRVGPSLTSVLEDQLVTAHR
jgi:hypothetical protein